MVIIFYIFLSVIELIYWLDFIFVNFYFFKDVIVFWVVDLGEYFFEGKRFINI